MERQTWTGSKVFSATKAADRDALGDRITKWLKENPTVEVLDKTVNQSSDEAFHCLSIVLFYRTT